MKKYRKKMVEVSALSINDLLKLHDTTTDSGGVYFLNEVAVAINPDGSVLVPTKFGTIRCQDEDMILLNEPGRLHVMDRENFDLTFEEIIN